MSGYARIGQHTQDKQGYARMHEDVAAEERIQQLGLLSPCYKPLRGEITHRTLANELALFGITLYYIIL